MVQNRNVQNCPEVSQRINSRLCIYGERLWHRMQLKRFICAAYYFDNVLFGELLQLYKPTKHIGLSPFVLGYQVFCVSAFRFWTCFSGGLVSFSLRANQKGDLTAGIRKPYHHLPHSSRTSPINIRGRTTPMYMRSHETSGIPLFTWFCAIVNTLIYFIFYSAGVRGIYAG